MWNLKGIKRRRKEKNTQKKREDLWLPEEMHGGIGRRRSKGTNFLF